MRCFATAYGSLAPVLWLVRLYQVGQAHGYPWGFVLLGQRHNRRQHRTANRTGRMTLSGCVFDKPGIARAKTSYGPITQANFQGARQNNHILPLWRRMPVNELIGREFAKCNGFRRLRRGEDRVRGQALVLEVGLPVTTGIQPKNCHERAPLWA